MKYGVVSPAEVNSEIMVAAHKALAYARKELRLPMVRIKWFRPMANIKWLRCDSVETFESDEDIRGLFVGKEPDVIYIRAGQFEKATQKTVYHETFHLCQFRMGFGFGDHSEELAQGFAEDMMKRMELRKHDRKLIEEDEETYYDHMIGKDWSISPDADKAVKTQQASGKENITYNSSGFYNGSGYYKKTFGRTV